MTSDVGVCHLPDLLSGPCGCQRYYEINTPKSKVQRETSPMNSDVGDSHLPESVYGPCG
jgi:hypothetical protein